MITVIEKHKKAASHLEEAAKFHHEAAKHHEIGNHKKAEINTVKANSQLTYATELEKEINKYHIKRLFLFKKDKV